MLDVASSNTIILLFFKTILAKQSSCFCPTESSYELLESYASNFNGIFYTYSFKLDYSNAFQICYSL
jgi:hypothetical protein